MTNELKIIDLFSGCGGMSLGFQDAGAKIVLALENWDAAIGCYKDNFAHDILSFDLSQVEEAVALLTNYECDAIIGGPPCQDFSHAGKRIEGDNANLTVAFANIVCNLSPKYFVFENVDRAEKSNSYAQARDMFVKNNYELFEKVFDASLCGVPQKRKRFFCVGLKNGDKEKFQEIVSSLMGKKPMTIRDYMGKELDTEFYYRHPRNYGRRAIFSIDEPSPTVRGVNRPVPPTYKIHPADATSDLAKVRTLTTMERARIQTFPPSFKLSKAKTDSEQMIGNAVPVNLAKFIADCLIAYDSTVEDGMNNIAINVDAFKDWLQKGNFASGKVVNDIASRAKRVATMINIHGSEEDDLLLLKLDRNQDFAGLSMSVKSQLRKSFKLYRKFLKK